MNATSRYELVQANDGSCPDCGLTAWLLCPIESEPGLPTFYLCGYCGYVGEVGVGEIGSVML
jgi:hypothetical protein